MRQFLVIAYLLFLLIVSGVRFDDVFNFPFCERTVYTVNRINAISRYFVVLTCMHIDTIAYCNCFDFLCHI